MNKIFFDNWESLLRIFIITLLAYFALIVLLRISGKRTLSKMNAFDFVVTIAIGSIFATILLNESVALADGLLALVLLIGLQYLITFLAVRFNKVSQWVKGKPTLIVYNGEMLTKAMINERVNKDEVYAVLRKNGVRSIKDAKAVILETDGSLTVMNTFNNKTKPETLRTVGNYDQLKDDNF